MNEAQQRTLDRILKEIPRFDFYTKDGYEIKKQEITEYENYVWVYIVTGGKSDEGTLASVLCRKYRLFSIGKRGGVKTFTGLKNKSTKREQRVSVFELLNRRWYR